MPIIKYKSKEEAKIAQKEKIRLWRLKNKERIKLIVKEYHRKNPDKVKKSHRKYYETHTELVKKKSREQYLKNPRKKILLKKNKGEIQKAHNEQIKLLRLNDERKKKLKLEQRKLIKKVPKTKIGKFIKVHIKKCSQCSKLFSTKFTYKKYCSRKCSVKHLYNSRRTSPAWIEKQKEIKKQIRKNNPEKIRLWQLKYYSSEKGQITHLWDTLRKRIKTYTLSKVQTSRKDMDKVVGCSKLFLLKYIESKFYDHPTTNKKMTWENTKEWHIDHITPLAILDPRKEDHFNIANHFSNLQPMWADENQKKSYKVISGYGVAHLKRKFYKIQKFGDLTKIKTEPKALEIIQKLQNSL